jgi:hypothetical protein
MKILNSNGFFYPDTHRIQSLDSGFKFTTIHFMVTLFSSMFLTFSYLLVFHNTGDGRNLLFIVQFELV